MAKRMEKMLGRYKLRDAMKIRQAAQIVSGNLDFQAIRSALGL